MTRSSVSQWDATAGNNTDIGGINIDEGMAPGDVNNAIREVMAQIKSYSTGVLPAGTVQAYLGATAPAGWLLLNGDTLGSAASTAAQGSDDYQALYELIWNSMGQPEAPVAGDRGQSANDDWAANKTIQLPDATGRAIFGKEATAARLTAAVSLDGATLGNTGGDQRAQDHTHPQGGVQASPNGSIAAGADVYAQPGTTGTPNGSKHGGDSGNVPPAIVLAWIVKT